MGLCLLSEMEVCILEGGHEWSYLSLGCPIPEKLGAGKSLRSGVQRPFLPGAMLLSDSEEQVSLATWISCWLQSVLALSHEGLSDIWKGKCSENHITLQAP